MASRILQSVLAVFALAACLAMGCLAMAPQRADCAMLETASAQGSARGFEIVYNLGGGSFEGKHAKTIGKGAVVSVASLAQPTRAYYTFAGWYADKKLTKKASVIRGVATASKRTLYAKWKTKSFSVSYALKGGDFTGGFKKRYTMAAGMSKLPVPYRDGYSFMGWYADRKRTQRVVSIPVGSTGDRKLYAAWKKRVLVAHRGYCADGAEANSLSAYQAAADKGFTYVETDVRFTADGEAVLSHDASLQAYAKDADGNVSDELTRVRIAKVTLEQLQNDYVVVNPSGAPLEAPDDEPDASGDEGIAKQAYRNLTQFDEFIVLCKQLGLSPRIELKEGTKDQVLSLVDVVKRHHMAKKVRWASFHPDILKYVKDQCPSAKFGLIVKAFSEMSVKTAKWLATSGGDAMICLWKRAITKARVKICRDAGVPVGIWTLGDEYAVQSYNQYAYSFTIDGIAGKSVPKSV